MTLFMDVDVHRKGGVSAADVAGAHQRYLATHGKYGVDETEGRILCLVEAPDAEAANLVHKEAHGWSPTRSTRSPEKVN